MSFALKDIQSKKVTPAEVGGDSSLAAYETVRVPSSPTPLDISAHEGSTDENSLASRPALPTAPHTRNKDNDEYFYKVNPSRWKTPEFIFYGIMFVLVIPQMFGIMYGLSVSNHSNYKLYENQLSPGWILGRKVDNSDAQYHAFRKNIPILSGLVAVYTLLSWAYKRFFGIKPGCSSPKSPNSSIPRIPFLLICSLMFLYGLFGTSLIKIFIILTANYAIAKGFGSSKYSPIASWIFNLAILFANEIYDGYRFGWVGEPFAFLDEYRGVYPRWHVNFNITMLRLLSFNMDYYWHFKQSRDDFDKSDRDGAPLTEKDRIQAPCYKNDYNFITYLTYVTYSPLYIAGPIITFNNFVSQLRYAPMITNEEKIRYFARLIGVVLTMEIILHFFYVNAIQHAKAWGGDTAAQLSMIGYFSLNVVWLKLLIPWRFFRFWSLLDGVSPPENMVRCMSNNYSALGFWRAWHRSYNQWTLRYIYIPLGGSRGRYPILSQLLVFTFVALWHDLSLKLLAWGWLVVLFILPEVTATKIFGTSTWRQWPYYRHLCASGGVINIVMMMIANLVGFCVGLDGVQDLLKNMFGSKNGLVFFGFTAICIFVAVQVMFEWREHEKRRGIFNRF